MNSKVLKAKIKSVKKDANVYLCFLKSYIYNIIKMFFSNDVRAFLFFIWNLLINRLMWLEMNKIVFAFNLF